MTQPSRREAELGIRYDADGVPIRDTDLPSGDDAVWQRAGQLHAAHPDIVSGVNREQHTVTLIVQLPLGKFLSIIGWIKHGRGRPPRIKPLSHYR